MPERIDGLQCLNDSEDEWVLTLEGFVKFQLRRGAVAGAGYEPLKKNLSNQFSTTANDLPSTILPIPRWRNYSSYWLHI